MGTDLKRMALLTGSALALCAAGLSPLAPGLKTALCLLCLALLLTGAALQYRSLLLSRRLMAGLYETLSKSFEAMFQEITDGHDLGWAREVLYEKGPERHNTASFFESLKGLFNRQVALFRSKNRQIRDLNEKILFSKKQLEAVFDVLNDGLCIVDRELKVFRLNRAFADYCGSEIKDLLGRPSHQLFPGAQKARLDECARKTFQTGERVTDVKLEAPSGDSKLYFTYGTFPICREGTVEYVLEHFRNVTHERKINEQLIRSANLATIGTMITGIAHEMNNPLSGISGCAQNMVTMPDTFGLNEKGRERLRDIMESANRAETILKDLLDLSRKKESQFIIMNVVPVLEKSLKSIHIRGFDRIRTVIRVVPDTRPIINCDPARLTQVFINLFTNATLSMLEKAEVEAKKENNVFSPLMDIVVRREGNFLNVSVTDNGMGIPAEKMPFIFDPFYTTRPPGQGTGLGLSICSKIMLEHNGRIYAESGDGKTSFMVEFPLPKTS